jgi:hypothetical protein
MTGINHLPDLCQKGQADNNHAIFNYKSVFWLCRNDSFELLTLFIYAVKATQHGITYFTK